MYDTLAYVDIDALKATRGSDWKRLHVLSRQRHVSGEEIEELSSLYETVTRDLARIRTENSDPEIIRVLSRDLASARARLTGTRNSIQSTIARWFKIDLPAALYEVRWWIITVAALFIVVTGVHIGYMLLHPELFALLGTPIELKSFAEDNFVQYYHQDTNAEFGASVWIHNSTLAVATVGTGLTGVLPVKLLYDNAESLGITAAIVIKYGGWWHFFRFILPHGLPELSAIFIAGAAGLRVFWALIVPGKLSRLQSTAKAGRSMTTVALGMVILLFISGILEGFVTPSGLPDVVRLGLGTLTVVLLWVYIYTLGRWAAQAGYIGDLEDKVGGYYASTN